MTLNTTLMFSKASDEWATPQDLFDALNTEFQFAVDAAATAQNAKCPLWFGPGGLCPDALALKDWRPDIGRSIWLNPPYSQVRAFMAKAYHESTQHDCTVVCLVPSRTDTRWWHQYVWDQERHRPYTGVEIRFIKGRLKFGGATSGAPFPSVIVVFRPV